MKRLRATGIMARAGAVPFWGLLGAVLAILLLAGPVGSQQPPAQRGDELPVTAVRQIEELLAAKAQRTPAQRKVSSQLLDAAESAQRPETDGIPQRVDRGGGSRNAWRGRGSRSSHRDRSSRPANRPRTPMPNPNG